MVWNWEPSLAELRARVLPFGAEWREQTGRHLSAARDGLDFLTAMKGRDDFWAALAAYKGVSPRRAPARSRPRRVS